MADVMRIAIMGDVGGHLSPFQKGLEKLGLSKTDWTLPADLTVIQVGDLVHKGPDSNKIVRVVDDIMKANPGQWVQLVGNHESQYLGGPQFWGDFIGVTAQKTLHRWWNKKQMIVACAVRDKDSSEDLLVTHAGLSPIFWERFCNKERDASKVAKSINAWKKDLQFSPGLMLGEAKFAGGPVWAHVTAELYVPWYNRAKYEDVEVPFSQVHGHTTSYWWSADRWTKWCPEELQEATDLDKENNISILHIGNKRFISVDPGFSEYTSIEVQPALVFDGEVLV